jgi:NAD(P)-dependent dehydrogenase (short-subunit alcohol dehydrogenase family)
VVLYNASYRARGPFLDLVPREVARSMEVSAFGAFLVAQEAARRMVARGEGAIFFTGASASVKGYEQSAPFAMGKFALRGLAQSMARELGPKGIHVAHFVIDGGVRSAGRGRVEGAGDTPDSLLDPVAIAEAYLAVLKQPRSAWSLEVELRPWVERF